MRAEVSMKLGEETIPAGEAQHTLPIKLGWNLAALTGGARNQGSPTSQQ